MMRRKFLFFLLLIPLINNLVIAQKCSKVQGGIRNVTDLVECINVESMNDIANEIKSDWSYVRIINKASHTQFTNIAVNVPFLDTINTLDLSCVGKLILDDSGFSNNYNSLKNLDISNTGLTGQIKSSWFSRRTLEALDVSKNGLTDLRKEQMKFFPNLRYLNASFNEIKLLEPGTFLESKKLEIVSLSYNSLPSISFANLPNLRALYVRSNNLANTHGSFLNLPKLEIINIADNNIAALSDRGFQTLESLKYLNISNNKLASIGPYWFDGCDKTKLIDIDLSFNNIVRIDGIAFNDLSSLTHLDVSNNVMTDIIDKTYQKLINLQSLNIHHNRIEKIAVKAFESLMQLRNLDISHNRLTTFSLEMFGGSNKFTGNKLRKLNLSNNKLMTIDSTLFAILKNLVSLNLSFNEFREIKVEHLKANVNLNELFINDNEIEFLHQNFFKTLTALEEIYLHNNRITFIPDTTSLRRPLIFSIGHNPFQCSCLREFIIWARMNKVKVENFKSNPENPDCVVLPETQCIKTLSEIDSYGVYDKFIDGMVLDGADRANFFF